MAYMLERGYTKSLLDPCLWIHRPSDMSPPDRLMLLDVDDFIIGTKPSDKDNGRAELEVFWKVGKLEVGTSMLLVGS